MAKQCFWMIRMPSWTQVANAGGPGASDGRTVRRSKRSWLNVSKNRLGRQVSHPPALPTRGE